MRENIGVVFQGFTLFPHRTVPENIRHERTKQFLAKAI